MLLRYAILSLLAEEEMHGYKIKSAFEERVGFVWVINFGQIYATLKELKRRELIVGRLESNGGHMGRWVYTATARGRRALGTWLARRPRAPIPARNEIFIRLLGAEGGSPDLSLAQIESQEQVYRECRDELKLRRSGVDTATVTNDHRGVLPRLVIDATLFQIDAHLRWLRHCARELRRRGEAGRGRAPTAPAASHSRTAGST